MEKKKLSMKLSLNKEEITNLTREEMSSLRGGNDAPTYVNPQTGGYCTVGYNDITFWEDTCTGGCTGPCPSQAQTGCDGNYTFHDCVQTAFNYCFTNHNCTYTQCTNDCPVSINDATCTCVC